MKYRVCKRYVDLTIRQRTIKKVKYMPLFKCYVNFILLFFTVNGNIEELLYTSEKNGRGANRTVYACILKSLYK